MPLLQSDTFKFSSTFYALDWSNATVETIRVVRSTGTDIEIPAVWFKRKNGVVAVCAGVLNSYIGENKVHPDEPREAHLEYLKENFDGRYGGRTDVKWNGSTLWAPNMEYAEQQEWVPVLNSYLNSFPEIPEGYEGWYSINGKV